MNDDEKNFQSIIAQKCPLCFRKDECMLYSSKHAGVELCLGPFKDQEDRLKKIREDRGKEAKPKADIQGLVRKSREFQYWLNKTLFDSQSGSSNRNPDETEE